MNDDPVLSIRTESEVENNENVAHTITDNNLHLMNQLNKVRAQKHLRYMYETEITAGENNDLENHLWPAGTICVMGDSMLHGLDERRLGRNTQNVKVRCFPGTRIDDLYDYCKPILKKQPSYIILHVGSNESNNFTSRNMVDKILGLKLFIASVLPTCKILISTPITRFCLHVRLLYLLLLRGFAYM